MKKTEPKTGGEALPDQAETGGRESRPPALSPRNGWNFAADTVRKATLHYEPEAKELLWWFFQWGLAEQVSLDDAARRVKYNSNTLYKIYTDRYRSPKGERQSIPAKLVDALKSLRSLENRRRMLGKTEFVRTPTVCQVWDICDIARASNTVAFVYGKSHTGKTWALVEYAKLHNHGSTLYVRIPAAGGKMELLRRIAAAIGVPHAKINYEKLKPRVLRAITRDMLLIFDEMHQFSLTYRRDYKWACVELIREIHDLTECGMVLCGTHIWRDEFNIGRDRELLEQFDRRGLYKLELGDEPTKGDLAAICKAFGLAYPQGDDADTLRSISQKRGLKAVTEVLRQGLNQSRKREERLSWRHVSDAWRVIENLARKPKFNT